MAIKRLQVLLGNSWQYVFCRNERLDIPVITDTPKKAVHAHGLKYFESKFGNLEFRVT